MTPTEWLYEVSQRVHANLGDLELVELYIKDTPTTGKVLYVIMRRGEITSQSALSISHDVTKRGAPIDVAKLVLFEHRRSIEKQGGRMNPIKPTEDMDEVELKQWMAAGYEPAVTEWLNRHPEAEASDGGRLG